MADIARMGDTRPRDRAGTEHTKATEQHGLSAPAAMSIPEAAQVNGDQSMSIVIKMVCQHRVGIRPKRERSGKMPPCPQSTSSRACRATPRSRA